MDYTGLNLNEIQLMELDEYLFYMREAYIYSLNQTKKGREYLDNCWRITQKNLTANLCEKNSERREKNNGKKRAKGNHNRNRRKHH